MKNTTILYLIFSVLLFSCGTSEAELKQQQAVREQFVADSIAQIYESKLQKIEQEKAIADSLAKEQQKIVESVPNLRLTLNQKEKQNPLRYLALNYDLDYKVIGRKDIVKGRIDNLAKVAAFKDIELRIDCYSKTNTYIKSYEKVIYEFIFSGESYQFEYKFKFPKETKKVDIKIIRAKPV